MSAAAAPPWVWDRPEDGAIYREAVREAPGGDGARCHARDFVGRVLTAGFGEYYDYQDAVERHAVAAEDYEAEGREGARRPGRHLLVRVWLVTLRLQVVFMRRQWRKSLPAALTAVGSDCA
ncbi:hypothetical protein GPA10_33130 [Streptomyces sp. p1417]|uniref:Uncharacterized protein n=1 Tax=Streptomyces typhae TaxID=2681492 RepID=A0A6L6X6N2_9ACTN|nr:hypothetical protein [Streptomyces typhae]MVO89468.1 hypothetical protein [Streptomyces typhae]